MSDLELEIYKDGAKKSVSSLGRLGADLIDAFRLKFTRKIQLAASQQRILDNGREDAEQNGTLQSPPPSIAVPLLEDMTLRGENDVIGDCEAMVLSMSIDSRYSHVVHPKFVEALKNMANDEVAFMKNTYRSSNTSFGWAFFMGNYRQDVDEIANHDYLLQAINAYDLDSLRKENQNAVRSIMPLVSLDEISVCDNLPVYFLHLLSLGFISSQKTEISALSKTILKKILTESNPEGKQDINNNFVKVRLTSLGILFLQSCGFIPVKN